MGIEAVFAPIMSGLGAAAPALQLAGAAVGAAGAYGSSKAAKSAYQAQAQVARNNALIAGWQADDAIERGRQTVMASRLRTGQLKGTQRARMAANGVDLGQGSALNILADTDFIGELDANAITDNAAKEAWALRAQASNFSADANLLKSRGDAERPWLAAGTSLLTSAGKVAANWYSPGGAMPGPGGGARNYNWGGGY